MYTKEERQFVDDVFNYRLDMDNDFDAPNDLSTNKKVNLILNVLNQRYDMFDDEEKELAESVKDKHTSDAMFIVSWGRKQDKIAKLHGFEGDDDAIAEMCINFGYVWVDDYGVWVDKNELNDTDKEILNELI